MVFLVQIIQPIQQQVFVDEDLPLTVRLDHLGVPAGHDDRRHGFGLGLHALDHTVDHGGVAVEDTGAHGVDGGAAKDGGGLLQGDVRQLRGPTGEGLHGDADAGDDNAALIGALAEVGEGGGRAHVDDDDGLGILLDGRHGGGHDVRAQLVVDLSQNVHPRLDPRPDDHGPHAAELLHGPGHGAGHGGHNAGDHRPGDALQVRPVEVEHIQQVDGDLVPRLVFVRLERAPELEAPLWGK